MNLKKQVKFVLENYPETRNSDIRLMGNIWVIFYKDMLIFDGKEYSVKLKNLYDLPREDNIKRIRAKLQNEEKKYLPTDPEILKKRKCLEEKWRNILGYNPELRTI